MLELLKVILGSIIILGGIGYVGNDCTLPDLSYEEEIVEEVAPIEEPIEPIELTTLQKVYVEVEGKSLEESKAILNEYGIQFTEEKTLSVVGHEIEYYLYAETETDIVEVYDGGGAEYTLKDGKIHDNIVIWPSYSMSNYVGWPGNEGWYKYEGSTREEQMIYLNEMETK